MAPVRALIAFAAAAWALAGAGAWAQSQTAPVTSPGPDSVAVTVYRDPDRDADRAPDLHWLQGYALITEKRTVTIPAGRAVIRFEGVAGGILPESAIITGLPEGVREKNLDADLLSPRSLYAHTLGRPVTIRRTRDGKTTEERAIIRSGPEGSAVLETKDGVIAVDCQGNEKLVYDEVPAGLSAKPTLSVETDSSQARQVTITLSYLAWGFDWQANYVATMRPDGKSAELFAWVTLANSDVTSFPDADTMVVAGKVNREDSASDREDPFGQDEPLTFQCLSETTEAEMVPQFVPPVAMPAPEPIAGMAVMQKSMATPITVVTVERVALGDLQAYRVPHPTTVASQSQKQVALLVRESVPVDVIYKSIVYGETGGRVTINLRTQNRLDKQLGVPLPAGKVAVFEPRGDSRMLIGEGSIDDKTVGEDVEVEVAQATQVATKIETLAQGKDWIKRRVTVTNANPFPVRFEAAVYPQRMYNDGNADPRIVQSSPRLGRKNGNDVWIVTVPANGSATLRFRSEERAPSGR
jgi:hypothetical protein